MFLNYFKKWTHILFLMKWTIKTHIYSGGSYLKLSYDYAMLFKNIFIQSLNEFKADKLESICLYS